MGWEFETDTRFQEQLDWARAFVREEVVPLETLPLDWPTLQRLMAPLKAQVKERGLWAAFLEEELGGGGWGQVPMALLSEVLGEALWAPSVFGSRAPDSGNAELLARFASPELRDRYFDATIEGDIRSCFSMTEPGAGADPTGIATTAVLDGDEWVIDGHKWFSSNATDAAYLLVMCVTDPDAPPSRRFSIILVPRDAPGLDVVRDIPALDDVNRHLDAVQPDTHAEVLYRGVRVPRENVLGEPGDGWAQAQARLGPGRIHHAMRWLGQTRRAFDMLCERAVSREVFGTRLADKQIVQDWIAESMAEMQAARLMTLQAAWIIDTKGVEHARTEISLIKFWGARVLHNVIDRAIQVHGSLGYSGDMPLEAMYRLARAARIYDGPDEVHKTVVARQVLKGYTAVAVPTEHVPTRRAAAEARWASELAAS
ncbi:MAG TPA: acyl-CoA dehydrogenase family protein [Iamia sp.]|nr:acyl-CoA dehydrogenase family protein [Iamia sp.]